jgi:hypothetical protein
MTENERFGLVFVKTWSIISATGGPVDPMVKSFRRKRARNCCPAPPRTRTAKGQRSRTPRDTGERRTVKSDKIPEKKLKIEENENKNGVC